MNIKETIKRELEDLVKQGDNLHYLSNFVFASRETLTNLPKEQKERCETIIKNSNFASKYQEWYGKSLEYLSAFLPSRKNDFIELYKKNDADKRKSLSLLNYGIQDAIVGIYNARAVSTEHGATLLKQQVDILKSVLSVYESSIKSLLLDIQEQVLDDEIASAKKLISINLRAAGSLAGVILERHLKIVCQNNTVTIRKQNPAINDYNDALKSNGVIQLPVFRNIQLLGDLRNLCDHSKPVDPTSDDVSTLIDGVEKIIKTVY